MFDLRAESKFIFQNYEIQTPYLPNSRIWDMQFLVFDGYSLIN